MDSVGSSNWSNDVENGSFPAGSNKCNLFVYDTLLSVGIDIGLPNIGGIRSWLSGRGPYPVTAGQWGDASYTVPGFEIVYVGWDIEGKTQPGDVIAQAINYWDASGHVVFAGPGNTIIGTSGTAYPAGLIKQQPNLVTFASPGVTASPFVVRRYVGGK